MEICPDKYNEYVEKVKQDGYELDDVPDEYMTEEICKLAVQQHGFALQNVPLEYLTEELIFMAQQTRLYYRNIPTELTKRIFQIYRTIGE